MKVCVVPAVMELTQPRNGCEDSKMSRPLKIGVYACVFRPNYHFDACLFLWECRIFIAFMMSCVLRVTQHSLAKRFSSAKLPQVFYLPL